MSKILFWRTLFVLICTMTLLWGQEAPQAPVAAPPAEPASPVAEQPQIKSQEDLEAIQAIMNALDPASRIQAADELVNKFADSEFKGFALQMAAVSAQMLNDFEKLMIYGERTVEADPNNYVALLAMSGGLAQTTREFDLDRDEKLKKAEDYSAKALEILETAPRPNEQVNDAMWKQVKGDFRAQAYESYGMIALVRKEYPKAVENFKKSIDEGATPNPGTKVRLASAYNQVGNHNEAIVVLDEVLTDPQLIQGIRQIAQNERLRSVTLRDSKAKK